MLRILFNKKLILLLLLVAALVVYQPSILNNEQAETVIMSFRPGFLPEPQSDTEGIKEQVLGATHEAKNILWEMTRDTTLPSGLTGLPEEVIVEDYVAKMTDEIKQLPEEQLNQVKIRFCEGVIEEASKSNE